MPDRLGGVAYAVPDDAEKYLEYLRMLEENEGYVPPNALVERRWISVPNPIPHREDYDTQFLLSGVTGGRVPPAIMNRMTEQFRLGGQRK